MSSTLYVSDHLAPVVSLTDARARLRGDVVDGVGDTLMVRCGLVSDDTVYRWVGIHEHTRISECRTVIATVFGIHGEVGSEAPGELELRDVLRRPCEVTGFTWGLWEFTMQLADVYKRDESTPPSICVAGAGQFGDRPFNIREINAQLLGVERAKGLKELVRDDAREVISRATSHDFLPLIQALGMERATGAGGGTAAVHERLAALPVEEDPRSRDAFWASVLANACCADDAVTCELTESIMASLGWEDMDAAEIRALCPASLAQLDEMSADLPLPERLDVYRDLLRG